MLDTPQVQAYLPFAAGLLWVTSFRMDIPGSKRREISIERCGENLRSMVGRSKSIPTKATRTGDGTGGRKSSGIPSVTFHRLPPPDRGRRSRRCTSFDAANRAPRGAQE